MKTTKDILAPGLPVLLVSGSMNSARMTALESIWEKGEEATEIDAEFEDASTVESTLKSASDFVVILSSSRASEETQDKILEFMHDPRQTVVVADCKIPSRMGPEKFAHYLKF